MAQVPYDGGVPTVAPDVRTPDDTNPVRASAANFGGAIGAALEKAGEGIGQIADFHSQVVLDQAKTQLGEGDRYLLHGDPSKTTIGADGKPQPDVGFLNTNGRDTLDRQASVLQKREDLFTGIRKNLNPKEQLELDDYWRRYRLSGDQQIADKADQAQKVWATGVAQSASKNAIDDISVNADSNPARVEDAFHANREARIKEAQLTYGVNLPPEIRKNVIAGADRESLIAQTEAISVKDPVKAQSILDKNRATAGPVYDELSAKFRERANRQTSIAEGQKALQGAAQTQPAPASAPSHGFHVPEIGNLSPLMAEKERQHNLPAGFLPKMAQIESGGRANAHNPSGAAGMFQFMPSTAAHYGLTNPYDPVASTDAAARLASDNAKVLRLGLGREPTAGELYLAHQQGAGGAARLLANPNASAASIVGTKAVIQNGGTQGMTAGQFAGMWLKKFGEASPDAAVAGPGAPEGSVIPGTPSAPQVPGAPPPSMRANAYQTILNNPDLSPEVKQGALTYINQTLAAQQIAADEDAKAKKAANDQSADGYVKRMLTNQTQGIVEDIANDQHLTWETRRALGDAALQNSGDDTEKLKREGGPGYWNAYKAIFAEPDDPSRIADATEIWKRAGPDGDLTLKGAKDLVEIMTKSHKDPEQNAINTTKVGLLKYAQSILTIDRAPRWEGEVVKPDLEGQRIFNAKFIPKFEAAYSDWVKKGKAPMDFLTQETVDKLAQGLRPKAQMDAARLAADNAAAGIEAVPPAPANTNPALWSTIVTHPPTNKDGVPIPMAAWSTALQMLVNSPTQATIDQFNASQFGRAGMDGATILQQLQPPPAQAPAGSAVAAPAHAAPPQPAAAAPPSTFHAPRLPRTGVSAAPAPAVAPAAVTPPKPGHGGLEHPTLNPEPQKPANPQPLVPRTQGKTVGEILKEALPVLPRKVNPPRKPHAGEDVDPSKKTRK